MLTETTNTWLKRGFLLYAHQGGALDAPASTLFAMEQALQSGANGIELDVHRTRDGVLVVSHDPVVDTTTNGSGAIADLDYEYISRLNNAYYFTEETPSSPESYPYRDIGANNPKFSVARREEVLSCFPDVVLNLDIKQTFPAVTPYEEQLALMLRHYGRQENTIVASFHDKAIERFSEVAPEFATAPGAAEMAMYGKAFFGGTAISKSITRHVALQVPAKVGSMDIISKSFVETAHELGLAIHVWTINDEKTALELLDTKVDAIMTDRPKALANIDKLKSLLDTSSR
jgi:glycerophosphoryl diester phosphodiesterase